MPVRDWLLSLSEAERKDIGDDIRTAEFGWPIGMPLCCPMKSHKGLWEVRIDLAGGKIARVLFCTHEGEMILLHGFIKKDAEDTEGGFGRRNEKNERSKMTDEVEKGHVGQSFGDFLKEQGTYEDTTEVAVKRVLSFQLAEAMKTQGISKVEMAKRLETSRSQLDRLLDPEHDGVTLGILARAAKAVGRGIRLELT